ncbi:unnamed protein product [Jaminaea pallidilutea]
MSSSHRNRGSGAISSEGNNNASAVAAAAASSNATSLRIERATSPEAIRKLVLDYLLHHCYIDTAQAFAKDGDPLEAGSLGVTGETTPAASTSRTGSQLQLGAASSASATPRRQAHPLAAPPWSGHDAMSTKDDGLARSQESAPETLARSIGFSRKSTAAHDEDEEMKGDDTEVKAGDDDDDDEEEEDIHALTTPRFKKRPVVGGDTSDDMHTVMLRREIRDEIMAGRIRRATELLNTNFPQVLNVDGALEATAGGPSSSPDGSRSGTKLKRSATTTKASIPSGPTSLDPRHLTLNLQIQSFIENVRVANSPLSQSNGSGGNGGNGIVVGNGTPTPASPAPHSLGINPATAASISRASSPAPSSASSASSSASGPSTGVHGALQSALANAQGLYASVQALKSGPYKDLYKRELENVTALLAYKDLERSPLRKYLDVKRRRSLAEQINSAIMFRSGRPAQPLLESAVRQTTFVWSQLHNDQVPIPAQHPVYLDSSSSGHFRDASGLGLGDPPWGSIGKEGLSGGLFTTTDADGKGKGKVPEAFHLPTFLSDR